MLQTKYRLLYMILVGIVITLLMKALLFTFPNNHSPIFDFLVTIFITIVIWEGNLHIDAWMNKHYPWLSHTKSRIALHLPTALLYSALTLFGILQIYNRMVCQLQTEHGAVMIASFLTGIVISVFLLTLEFTTHFFKEWKKSLVEMERYKTESAQAQLENLKNQVNPHFLFNNLSVLSSLVYKDQDKAVDFINQLSKVYRYVLENRNQELVLLQDEMKFLDAYMYLLQIRFDSHLQIQLSVDEHKLNMMLPPMSLQLLVENAIKHNEISGEKPLSISITTQEDQLIICNTLQARLHPEPSSKTGLKNIQDRYAYFTSRPVLIDTSNQQFCVTLPLLPPL